MSDGGGGESSGTEDHWRYLPVAEIDPVRPETRERARDLLEGWLERLRGGGAPDAEVAPGEGRLHRMSGARLEALVPEPPLGAQRAALHAVRRARARALLLRPDDGSWDRVLDEADAGDPERIAPPGDPPLREGLPDPVRERLEDPAAVHVPRLEAWYLRHHDGIGALRALLSALGAREGPWSADVSPWAWGWMRQVLPEARELPNPHGVAPMDGEALAAWFRPVGGIRLRRDGRPPDDGVFDALATRSRGSAGVAAAVWRACLRDGAEGGPGEVEEGRPDEEGVEAAGTRTVWMRHPSNVTLPSAASLDRDDLMVLHTVLIHGGGTVDTVRRALPLARGSCRASLDAARDRGLLDRRPDGRYRVRAAALPSVRARLRSETFSREVA